MTDLEQSVNARAGWYRYAALVLTCLALSGGSVIFSITSANKQAQRLRDADRSAMCALVVVQDDAYKTPPGPTTPVGKATAKALADLRLAYQCDKKG
jgi:hypothetical protein